MCFSFCKEDQQALFEMLIPHYNTTLKVASASGECTHTWTEHPMCTLFMEKCREGCVSFHQCQNALHTHTHTPSHMHGNSPSTPSPPSPFLSLCCSFSAYTNTHTHTHSHRHHPCMHACCGLINIPWLSTDEPYPSYTSLLHTHSQ